MARVSAGLHKVVVNWDMYIQVYYFVQYYCMKLLNRDFGHGLVLITIVAWAKTTSRFGLSCTDTVRVSRTAGATFWLFLCLFQVHRCFFRRRAGWLCGCCWWWLAHAFLHLTGCLVWRIDGRLGGGKGLVTAAGFTLHEWQPKQSGLKNSFIIVHIVSSSVHS